MRVPGPENIKVDPSKLFLKIFFLPSDDLEAGKDGGHGLAVLGEAGLVHEKDVNPGHTQEQVLHYGKVVVAPAQQNYKYRKQ